MIYEIFICAELTNLIDPIRIRHFEDSIFDMPFIIYIFIYNLFYHYRKHESFYYERQYKQYRINRLICWSMLKRNIMRIWLLGSNVSNLKYNWGIIKEHHQNNSLWMGK